MPIPSEQKESWLYELELNGFILFRNFLPLDLVEGMFEQMQPIVRGEMARVTAGDTTSLRGQNRMSFDIRYYIEKLKGPLDDDRFRRNPVIEELVTAVLGRWRYGVTKAECPCKDSDMMVWHPDTESTGDPAGSVRPGRLTFNVPLVDIDVSNGPMEVIPGSHRMHHHRLHQFIHSFPEIRPVKVLIRRGDAMLRDGNLLHRGTTNTTEAPRILLDQTYRAIQS
jgi:phytanoyl-CoA dioxygenase PhyH